MAFNPVDDYLAQVPEPARTTLEKLRATIRKALPKDATEEINYGMPAFRVPGLKRPVAGYAAFKTHCGYFPHSGSVLKNLEKELSGYECSKGGLKFPLDKPLPATLVAKLLKARIALG